MDKIKAYEQKIKNLPHYPLKVTFKLASPVLTGNYPICFDGLLNRAVALDIRGIDALDMDTDNLPDLPLPLTQSGKNKKYYHASIMLFDEAKVAYGIADWVKRWDEKNTKFVKPGERIPDIARGFFKAYKVTVTYISTPEVYFYAHGNPEEIERLLKHITNISKKSSQGYGKVTDIIVEMIETDKSVVIDGELMRPIPVSELPGEVTGEVFKQPAAYKPAYFDVRNYTLCAMPKPQLWSVK
ncbi:MAG: hypothetical protein H0Z24_03590 [Thermosipho sp. (in: Bacteria)]|nr:hypothetical protein [Thermosipho sp. (in: thermotogales)]